MAHKQIFVELEKVEKENTLNSGRLRGDSHKLWNIPWSCLPLVITLRPEKNCGKCHKNYLRLFFNETEIACSGVLNYPNYPFEQCSLQIHKKSDSKALQISYKTVCKPWQRNGIQWVSRFEFGFTLTPIHKAWYATNTNATILERPNSNTQLALHQDLLQCFPTTIKLPELPRCYGAMMDYMQYYYTPQQTTAL